MLFHSGRKSLGRVGLCGIALFATIVTVLEACGSASPPAVAIGIPQEPTSLNPLLDVNNEARQIISVVFDGLTNAAGLTDDLRQEFVPALAENVRETNPSDRRFLRIALRRGVKWHNGVDFKAPDVYFTWEAIHQSNSPLKVRLDRFIDDLRAEDDYTLAVRLREERIADRVLDLLSFKVVPRIYDPNQGLQGALPKNLRAQTPLVNQFNWKPVGTGPYQVDARPSGSEIVLKASALPVLGEAKIARLEVKRYPGWDVIAKGLGDESVNLVVDVPPEYYTQLDEKGLSKQAYSPYSFYAIIYNVTRPPFDNRDFRAALSRATDRSQLAAAFVPTERDVSPFLNESIYPHNYEHVQSGREGYRSRIAHDPERARQLLAPFSQNNRRVVLLYCSHLSGENANAMALAYKRMLTEAGVDVVLENAPNIASYFSSLKNRKFQAALVLYDGLDHFYELYDLFGPDATRNYSGFERQALTDRLSELKLTLSFDDVGRITRDIHGILDEEAPLLPLFTLSKRAYFSAKLQGLSINPEQYLNMLYLAELKKEE